MNYKLITINLNTINIGNKVDNSTLSIKCDNDIPYIEKSNDNNVENK